MLLRQSRTLLRHCCWCGRGLRNVRLPVSAGRACRRCPRRRRRYTDALRCVQGCVIVRTVRTRWTSTRVEVTAFWRWTSTARFTTRRTRNSVSPDTASSPSSISLVRLPDSSYIGTVLPHHSTVTTCQGSSLLQGILVSVTSQTARSDPNWLIDDFDRMFWSNDDPWQVVTVEWWGRTVPISLLLPLSAQYSLVFRASDLRLSGREFDPRPPHYRSVDTGMGDRLRVDISPRNVTCQTSQPASCPLWDLKWVLAKVRWCSAAGE